MDNCKKVKEEYFTCITKHNLGFDSELLKFRAAKKIQDLDKLKISKEAASDCSAKKFLNCLNKKFNLIVFDDDKMYAHFDEKYKDIEKQKLLKQNQENRKVKNNKS